MKDFPCSGAWQPSTAGRGGSDCAELPPTSPACNVILWSPVDGILVSNTTVSFWIAAPYEPPASRSFDVELWVVVGLYDASGGDDVQLSTGVLEEYGAYQSHEWVQISCPIPSALNGQLVSLAFRFVGSTAESIYLDDIYLSE